MTIHAFNRRITLTSTYHVRRKPARTDRGPFCRLNAATIALGLLTLALNFAAVGCSL